MLVAEASDRVSRKRRIRAIVLAGSGTDGDKGSPVGVAGGAEAVTKTEEEEDPSEKGAAGAEGRGWGVGASGGLTKRE